MHLNGRFPSHINIFLDVEGCMNSVLTNKNQSDGFFFYFRLFRSARRFNYWTTHIFNDIIDENLFW